MKLSICFCEIEYDHEAFLSISIIYPRLVDLHLSQSGTTKNRLIFENISFAKNMFQKNKDVEQKYMMYNWYKNICLTYPEN